MAFLPDRCPRSECPSRSTEPFAFHRKGTFRRVCDQRVIQRFRCLVCKRGFSTQTFRVDYRLKRPELLLRFFQDRVSKVTHRQSVRLHACSPHTEVRHFLRLAGHCEAFHALRMAGLRAARKAPEEIFLLDELETYEHHRKLKPVTVPVLIEKSSGFVLAVRVGAMAPRGNRTPEEERKLAEHIALEGERRSESAAVVKHCFERLKEFAPKDQPVVVRTDEKDSYEAILKELFAERLRHERTSSKLRRDTRNPLWPINHTLARLRDGVSRLVRETWAASKKRERLAKHLAIWVGYRNYVRGRTNLEKLVTPAMHLGLAGRQWNARQLLEWRILDAA